MQNMYLRALQDGMPRLNRTMLHAPEFFVGRLDVCHQLQSCYISNRGINIGRWCGKFQGSDVHGMITHAYMDLNAIHVRGN